MKKTKEDFLKIKNVEEYQAIRHCFSHLPVDEEIMAHLSFLYKDMHSYLGDLETFEKVKPEQCTAMKVRYNGESDVSLTKGKVYEVLSIEQSWFRIVDDTDEDYLFSPENFEIVMEHHPPHL